MKKLIYTPLLCILLSLTFSSTFAEENPADLNIKNAVLNRDDYSKSPLCSKNELTLWSCKSGKHIYSLCSSTTLTRTSGYMQYRASNNGKIDFTYPTEKKPPLGFFEYNPYPNGDAVVEFTNNQYSYNLIDPLRRLASLRVSGASKKTTEISCSSSSQALTLNYTIRLMQDSGLTN